MLYPNSENPILTPYKNLPFYAKQRQDLVFFPLSVFLLAV